MISKETKKEIFVKLAQGEDIDFLSDTYNIPISLLEEWKVAPQSVPSDVISNFFDITKKYDSTLEELKDKLELAAVGILDSINMVGFQSPAMALLIKINAESLAKLRTAFIKDSGENDAPQRSSTELSLFKDTLKD